MNENQDILSAFQEKRAAAQQELLMAKFEAEESQARISRAEEQIGRIDQMISQISEGLTPQTLPTPPRPAAPTKAAIRQDASPAEAPIKRGRGRPRKNPQQPVIQPALSALVQTEPTADEIRRQRLENQAQRKLRKNAVRVQKSAKRKLAAQSQLPVSAKPEGQRKRDGSVRKAILQTLEAATSRNTPVTLDELLDRMQSSSDVAVIRGSIRTTLYSLKREGLVSSDSGKWVATTNALVS